MTLRSDSSTPTEYDLDHPFHRRLGRILQRSFAILLILAGILFLLNLDSFLSGHPELPAATERLSYALLFVAGLFTGFHCVGMCGALVVGYTVKAAAAEGSKYLTHVYYGIGKTLSYTAIGALFGALGAIITFTPFMRGLAGIAAGVFLLLFGLATLNLFPALSRFRIKLPGSVMRHLGKAYRSSHSNPFAIGLLNGLMVICGPLQAMYIMAAGTGSPTQGAKMLFVFGLGTLPVMMSFGLLTSALSRQLAPRIVKASGVIVIGLGAIMLNRGLAMVGGGYDFDSLVARWTPDTGIHPEPAARPEVQAIRMTADQGGYSPREFTLRKGIPVKWIIQGESLNYCTHRIVVPSLNLEFDIHPGENLIEFTPTQAGVVPWSCWMGMIQGTFLVHEEPGPAPVTPLTAFHDHGHDHGRGHDHGTGHGHDHSASSRPQWMQRLLEKSAAAVEALRRNLHP